jgi:hypothetical protein
LSWLQRDAITDKERSVQSTSLPTHTTRLSARQRIAPIVTLLALAPIIVEFLFGSTHISMLYLLLPQIGVYGAGALLIRALARHRGRGYGAILLLGLAFAVAEECVILQTGLAPLFVAIDPQHIYGRSLGVNWVYLLSQLGYESVWAIMIPIQLTELIFPSRREDPWLGKWGITVAAIVYVVSSVVVWYLWGQAVHRFAHGPGYEAPVRTVAIALAVIAALVFVALGPWWPSRRRTQVTRRAPRPWLVRLVAFTLALLWFVLLILSVGIAPSLPAAATVASGLVLAALAFSLVWRWSASLAWGDSHRLALVSGALFASMLVGFLASGVRESVDLIGKLVLNVLAIIGLSLLAFRIRHRERISGAA